MANPIKKGSSSYKPPKRGIFTIMPTSWVPYAELMRLDRPGGYFVFFWHFAIGLSYAAAASNPVPAPYRVLNVSAYLALWIIILRGAVCAINDNLDQEFDRQVTRTRYRPIARGAVSTFQGHVFTIFLYVVEYLLVLPFPKSAIRMAAISTILLSVYPLGKRCTDFPQVFLGFAFSFAVFVSAAVLDVDSFSPAHRVSTLSLYSVGILWTVTFDTIYAHQDREDDKKAGVRSLAVRLGDNTKLAVAILSILQVGLLYLIGLENNFSLIYFTITCGGTALTILIMLITVDLNSTSSCAWWFGSGVSIMCLNLSGGFICEYVWKCVLSNNWKLFA